MYSQFLCLDPFRYRSDLILYHLKIYVLFYEEYDHEKKLCKQCFRIPKRMEFTYTKCVYGFNICFVILTLQNVTRSWWSRLVKTQHPIYKLTHKTIIYINGFNTYLALQKLGLIQTIDRQNDLAGLWHVWFRKHIMYRTTPNQRWASRKFDKTNIPILDTIFTIKRVFVLDVRISREWHIV